MSPTVDEGPAAEAVGVVDRAAISHVMLYEGQRIRWRTFGSGSPLVLIHGGHGSWMHWLRNVRPLARSHCVLVPDLPGFNDSDALDSKGPEQDPLAATIAALKSTLSQLIGEGARFDLAGFSFGGLVAARWAADCDGVRRLALLGPAGHGMARRQVADLLDWRLEDPIAAAAALRHNLATFMLHDPKSVDALAMAIHERSCRNTRFRSKAISRAGGLHQLIDRIQCPLLMLWGEHDVTAFPSEVAQSLRQDRAERDWCVVPAAGHWVQFERPSEVNKLLSSWFNPTGCHDAVRHAPVATDSSSQSRKASTLRE